MRPLALLLTLSTYALLGCGEAGPKFTPDQLNDALINLESQTHAILQAFERNDLKAADEVMHELARVYGSVNRFAEGVLDGPVATDLKKAVKQHLEAMSELHAPLHKPELPEDFDLEPIREKVLASIDAIHNALPADALATIQAAVNTRLNQGDEAAHDEDGDGHHGDEDNDADESHEGHDEDGEHDHGDEEGEEHGDE